MFYIVFFLPALRAIWSTWSTAILSFLLFHEEIYIFAPITIGQQKDIVVCIYNSVSSHIRVRCYLVTVPHIWNYVWGG